MSNNKPRDHDRADGHAADSNNSNNSNGGNENRHGRRNPHGERRFGMEFNVYSGSDRDHPGGRPLQSRLYRNPRDGWIRGVCAGLADYFGIAPVWFRWGCFFGLVFFTLPTLIVYFAASWFLPERPEHLYGDKQEESFWRGVRTAPDRTFSGLAHRFRSMERRLRSMEALVTSREFRLSREIDRL